MKLSLVVLTPGKSEGKAIPITLSQFLIGRDPQCQLRPASTSISKRHCAILVRSGKVVLRDLDSTNGTFVNEQQVKGEVELHHEDRVKLGPLLFGICIEASAPVGTPTPAPASKVPAGAKKPTTPLPKKPGPEMVDDDSAADWLLSTQDDGSAKPSTDEDIPGSSTVVMDPAAMDQENNPDGSPAAGEPGKDKAAEAKKDPEDTSAAAKAILQKYMRRPRT
jgi:predicted component of type VI protein secretion system